MISEDEKKSLGQSDTIALAEPTGPRTEINSPAPGTSSMPADFSAATTAGLAIVAREHYQVIAEFARGGLGRIMRARDLRTGRIVAIKEILAAGAETAARFAFEALVTANLQHPSTVPVYEVGRWPSGEPFYAMKLVSGRSLEDLVAETKSLRERVALVPHLIAVAEALAYAHGERIIHRDLKPANVMVGSYGETVVIDWGLAKNLATGDEADITPNADLPTAHHGATIMGTVLGTPAYMSPEQARGETVDERTDVYAIGAMLYQVLAGVRPFADALTPRDVLDLVVVKPPRPLASLDPEIPSELVTIVEKAMSVRAVDRYPTANELAADLKRFTTGQLVSAHRYSTWQLVRRFLQRNRAVVSVVAAAVLVLAVLGVYSVGRIVKARDVAEGARAQAEHRLAELFADQGRQALLGGDPERALAYLHEAMRHGDDTPATRFLVGQGLAHYAQLEAMLAGHTEGAYCVDFSPDGTRLLSAGLDQNLGIWDLASQRLVRAVPAMLRAAYTPDGRYVVAAESGSRMFVWGARDLVPIGSVSLPDHEVIWTIAVSPDGKWMAAAGVHGAVAWWEVATLRPVRIIPDAHNGEVYAVAFSPDGRYLASAGTDGVVGLFNTDGSARAELIGHHGAVWDVAFSPDSQTLASGGEDATAMLWNVRLGALRAVLVGHTFAVGKVAFDPTGARLVTGASDSLAMVWDVDSGKLITTLKGHAKVVNDVLFTPDGATVVTGGEDGTVRLWDPDSGAQLVNLDSASGPVSDMKFSPDGRRLAVANLDRSVRVWRVDVPPTRLSLIHQPPPSIAGAFDHDGDQLITSAGDDHPRIWNVADGRLLATLAKHDARVAVIAFSPDGARFLTASMDKTVRVYDARTNQVISRLVGHTDKVRWAAFSPDGQRVVTNSFDRTVRVWDAGSGALLHILEGEAGDGFAARFSPDGKRIVSTTLAWTGDLWDGETYAHLAQLQMNGDQVMDASFNADSTLLAVVANNTPAKIFNAVDGSLVTALIGHTPGHMSAITFRPDGNEVLTASGDGTARIWDPRTGVSRAALAADDTIVTAAAYRPDGQLIATGGTGGRVRIWDPASGQLLAEAPNAGQPYQLLFSPDGSRLAILPVDAPVTIWRLAPYAGTADELGKFLKCFDPWRVEGVGLVPSRPDSAECVRGNGIRIAK